jgi:hypothetical protein
MEGFYASTRLDFFLIRKATDPRPGMNMPVPTGAQVVPTA